MPILKNDDGTTTPATTDLLYTVVEEKESEDATTTALNTADLLHPVVEKNEDNEFTSTRTGSMQ